MVAKIMTGKSIKGALNYNEQKVTNGKATLLDGVGFLKMGLLLSFSEKLERLEKLASLHEEVSVNCVHINLNFDAMDKVNKSDMMAIADAYMDKIGFGGKLVALLLKNRSRMVREVK